ncbi:MAG: TIM barrel protein [Actinomycetota bacterium]|nr:TIM barrel protein [Actinomycetota bacterium]
MYNPDMEPRIAVCGHTSPLIEATLALAFEHHGHAAIDLSLIPTDLGSVVFHTHTLRSLSAGSDLEIRYHLPLGYREIGHADAAEADLALAWMTEAVSHVALAGGGFLTIHTGLPGDATRARIAATTSRLAEVVAHGENLGVRVCLENLRWGLTSDPDEFMGLVTGSGALVTLDVGHAASSDVAARGFGAEQFARMVAPYVRNAHVYEREESFHIAPLDLVTLTAPLDVLLDETHCDWWVVELTDVEEARRTRAMLVEFLAQAPVRLAG